MAKIRCIPVGPRYTPKVLLGIVNETRGMALATRVRAATTLTSRMIGLLRTAALPPGEGLWLSPCTSVHTFFMRYPIDVLFVDKDHRVLAVSTLPPWRVSRWMPKAAGVLELAAGEAARAQLRVGDRLAFKELI